MEHYVCRPVTHLPGYMQIKFLIPRENEFTPGQIYVQGDIAKEIGNNNFSVFAPQLIEDVENEIPCIILNGGFEELNDRRRVAGNPDYTQYSFHEGEVVTAIRLLPQIKFEISTDNIISDTEIRVGGYLIPAAGSNKLMYVDNSFNILSENGEPIVTEMNENIIRENAFKNLLDINSSIYLKIEYIKDFRVGGLSGIQYTPTLVVRVMKNHALGRNGLKIQANILDNLEIPIEENTIIGNLETTGGIEPYIYEFANGGMDNKLFILEGNNIKTNARITKARRYHISVKATDSENNSKSTTVGFLIDNPSIKSLDITTTQDIREGESEVRPGGLIATVETDGGTPPYVLSIHGENANRFKAELMSIKTGDNALVQGKYSFIVRVTDSKGKFLEQELEITVEEPYPDIESIMASGESGLFAPVPANTVVGHISVIGGTIPYEITLPQGIEDNDLFVIEDAIRTKEEISTPGEKKILIAVKDIHNKMKDTTLTLNIESPDITEITFTPQPDLKEGEQNVSVNAIVGTLGATGGTAPITYTIVGGDNADLFRISANTLRVKNAPLTSGTYSVSISAKDNYGKKYPTSITISINVM